MKMVDTKVVARDEEMVVEMVVDTGSMALLVNVCVNIV